MTASPARAARCIFGSFPPIPPNWRDEALAEKWRKVREVRRVVTGALEIERKERRIGSSLEAAPKVYLADRGLREALDGVDLAEIAITSGIELIAGDGPEVPSGSTTCPASPCCSPAPRARNAPAPGRSWKRSAPIQNFPSSPRAMPKLFGSSTRANLWPRSRVPHATFMGTAVAARAWGRRAHADRRPGAQGLDALRL